MTGYVRQSTADIVTSAVVEAAPVNAEFNQIETAFNVTTGHKHDGSASEGQQIDAGNLTGTLTVGHGGTGSNLSGALYAGGFIVGNNAATALTVRRNNLSGAATPTVSDDSSAGYGPTSVWLDLTNNKGWLCLQSNVGAAVWAEMSGTSDALIVAEASSWAAVASGHATTSSANLSLAMNELNTARAAQQTSIGRVMKVEADVRKLNRKINRGDNLAIYAQVYG